MNILTWEKNQKDLKSSTNASLSETDTLEMPEAKPLFIPVAKAPGHIDADRTMHLPPPPAKSPICKMN